MRAKMSREDRAKQFMPFAALKGFEIALQAKERIVIEKKELSPERMTELDAVIHEIKKQDIISVIYFLKDEYLKITGMVAKLDFDSRYVRVVNTKVSFDDIYEIKIEKKHESV